VPIHNFRSYLNEAARRVLITKQWRRRRARNPAGKLWNWLLYLSVGYGYHIWLAGCGWPRCWWLAPGCSTALSVSIVATKGGCSERGLGRACSGAAVVDGVLDGGRQANRRTTEQ
jgi:hypothetical protein